MHLKRQKLKRGHLLHHKICAQSCFCISRFDMLCAQVHWVGSKPILRGMQVKLHKPTMAIGYSLRMCARHVDSTNPGRSNIVFRSKVKTDTGSRDVESGY